MPQLMIKDEIQKLVYVNLKQHNQEIVDILRFVLSQINYRQLDLDHDITDEEVVDVLRKEIKKRTEAIGFFEKGKRPDLVDSNKKEIEIIKQFLPPELPDEEILNIIADILKKQQGEPVNRGKIIGAVVARTKGRADGAKIAGLVNQTINHAR